MQKKAELGFYFMLISALALGGVSFLSDPLFRAILIAAGVCSGLTAVAVSVNVAADRVIRAILKK